MVRDCAEGRVCGSVALMCLGDWVDVQGLCYHLMVCRCPRPVPWPESMLMFMGHAAAGDHTDVSGLHCHLGPL